MDSPSTVAPTSVLPTTLGTVAAAPTTRAAGALAGAAPTAAKLVPTAPVAIVRALTAEDNNFFDISPETLANVNYLLMEIVFGTIGSATRPVAYRSQCQTAADS
eukprot:3556275-Pleurochrysis_carterae.AAC.2